MFAQGLGNLYFVNSSPTSILGLPNSALHRAGRAHRPRGRQLARQFRDRSQYTGLVFDPINELIYVGTAPLAGARP